MRGFLPQKVLQNKDSASVLLTPPLNYMRLSIFFSFTLFVPALIPENPLISIIAVTPSISKDTAEKKVMILIEREIGTGIQY